jgi:hypothetical protein
MDESYLVHGKTHNLFIKKCDTVKHQISELIGTEKFQLSDCSDNQTCMRILSSNIVVDLGNGWY